MGLRACLDQLPTGYDIVQGRRGVLAVRSEYREALLALDHGPDDVGVARPSDLSGRRTLGELVIHGERLAVRQFHHGGLLRWMNGDRFSHGARPFEELILSRALAQCGVPTPAVIAARAQRARPCGWRLLLITKRVEHTVDTAHVLARLSSDRGPAARGDYFAGQLGAFVGRLHRAGLEHTDLTPRNMLIDESWCEGSDSRLWILDLDRCELHSKLTIEQRRRGLRRLLRYIRRRPELSAAALGRRRVARFLRAYHGALRLEGSDWKADWRSIASDAGRVSLWHRAGWALEESVGAGAATRAGNPT